MTANRINPDVAAELGRRIRARRAELGLTLREVAALTGHNVGYLSQVERASSGVSVAALQRSARALETRIVSLLPESIEGEAAKLEKRCAR